MEKKRTRRVKKKRRLRRRPVGGRGGRGCGVGEEVEKDLQSVFAGDRSSAVLLSQHSRISARRAASSRRLSRTGSSKRGREKEVRDCEPLSELNRKKWGKKIVALLIVDTKRLLAGAKKVTKKNSSFLAAAQATGGRKNDFAEPASTSEDLDLG